MTATLAHIHTMVSDLSVNHVHSYSSQLRSVHLELKTLVPPQSPLGTTGQATG